MSKYRSRTTAYAVKYGEYRRAGFTFTQPALVARRKLQALVAIGYSMREVAEHCELSKDQLQEVLGGERSKYVYNRTANQISKAYQALNGKPKPVGTAIRQRNFARNRGWAPPGAWDDINDESCMPKGML